MRKGPDLGYRRYIIVGFIAVISIIYVIRLFNLQLEDPSYKDRAKQNAFLNKTVYPSRGIIYDRDGRLVVYNEPTYDVMMIARDVQPFDTIDFCNTLGITKQEYLQRVAELKSKPGYSSFSPQTLITHLSPQDYGRLQEKLYRFPGFFIQKRIQRQYNTKSAANVLGNIREVNYDDIKADDYYSAGDYIGDLGVERSYEKALRGQKGVEVFIRNANGKIQGRYENGIHDLAAVSGRNLRLSLNIELQEYAESLMRNKKGAIVAIEPSTGEILCLVTAPGYDPALLVGRDRGINYSALRNDPDKPLFDRSVMGAYPPGSTFKPTQGLIFLQENVVSLGTSYPCSRGYINGGLKVGCHAHSSPIALKPALETSCNAYFCWGFKNMIDSKARRYGGTAQAFEVWKKHLVSMGYGYKLGLDVPAESRGFLPNAKFYNKVYGDDRWSANSVISVSIGQGEILATPVQIANLAATIANRGWFITPHVVKWIQDSTIDVKYRQKNYPTINPANYTPIAEGMRMAVLGGTCKGANLPGIEVAGKTGTAQNPHGPDHSAFMGFAPYTNPKIAVAVYVENAGFGATFGVPIGSLIIEKYLNGKIAPERKYVEERMLFSNTIKNSGTKKH